MYPCRIVGILSLSNGQCWQVGPRYSYSSVLRAQFGEHHHGNITMLLSVLSPLLSLLLTASSASQPSSWSSLGLLSSQASKRSAEENFLTDDMETSASDNIPETDSYDMADFKSPEARVEPYRRRKK